jgi:hypothetical protein
MKSNNRHIEIFTYYTTGLTRLYQQCNRTKTQTTEKKEKIKSPCFAFLIPKAFGTANTHLQVLLFWLWEKYSQMPLGLRQACKRAKSSIPQDFQFLPVF